ncbi:MULTISPECIES: amino acid ABC transporter substrate-binding protein [Thermodesulfovibrio]|uniref:Leu/ile/val-binding protein n=1 Tax=Thermodesulfovibrio yellowstonii (strain ATCC 51303 / DSM 11347 / YP87) TaxID=289376 RepID=B5YK45_THEYD|nr:MULTISPECIES: amino acid ABC transporter substrate-binding protein [Thermodesulfovibrio]ACI21571.1 leu/ile/val-binding protein [Thermodesulfovibrio yellowstonii DSM 11347]MDI6865349.1 amino acid ABC transporter substrate-binding protein [Thermodesulfovibrio yellowstonii]
MKRLSILILAVMLSFCLITFSFAADVIKFGAALSLTGKLAKEGNLVKNGYELWKETVNKKGGIKIGNKYYKVDIKYYDDESDPNRAAKLVEKLITEDGIKLILGPYGSESVFSTSAITEKYGALMVQGGAAADKLYTRGFKNLFGIYTVATEYMDDTLKMLMNKAPKPTTVAIVYSNDLFSTQVAQGAKASAQKYGYKVVYYKDYPKGTQDLSTVIVEIKAKNPDILIGCGHFQDTIVIVKQSKDYKLNPKAIAFSVGPTLPDFVSALKSDAEYILGSAQWTPTLKYKDPVFGSNANFVKAFKTKFRVEPNYHAAGGAAAAVIFQRAIEKAGTFTDINRIRESLLSFNEETLFGKIRFDSSGKVVGKGMPVIQILKGTQKTVYPENVAETKPVYPKPAWR